MKYLYFLILLTAATTQVFSQTTYKEVISALECINESDSAVQLLDYYEAFNHWGLTISPVEDGQPLKNRIHLLMKRLEKVDPQRSKDMEKQAISLIDIIENKPEEILKSNVDIYSNEISLSVPNGCTIKGIALVMSGNSFNNGMIIQKELWNRLSNKDKVGLILRASQLRSSNSYHPIVSEKSRYYNAIISSEEFNKEYVFENYIKLISTVGTNIFMGNLNIAEINVEKDEFNGFVRQDVAVELNAGSGLVFEDTPITMYMNGKIKKTYFSMDWKALVNAPEESISLTIKGQQSFWNTEMHGQKAWVSFYQNGDLHSFYIQDGSCDFKVRNKRVCIFDEAKVELYEDGNLKFASEISNTDAVDRYYLENLKTNRVAYFWRGYGVGFHKDGYAKKGVLYNDAVLHSKINNQIKDLLFKKYSSIEIDQDGYASKN